MSASPPPGGPGREPVPDDLWGVPGDAVEIDDPAVADQVLGDGWAAFLPDTDVRDGEPGGRPDDAPDDDRDDAHVDLAAVAAMLAGPPPRHPLGDAPHGDRPTASLADRVLPRRLHRRRGDSEVWTPRSALLFVAGGLLAGLAAGVLAPGAATGTGLADRTPSPTGSATAAPWPAPGARVVLDGPPSCPMYVVAAGAPAQAPGRDCFVVR